MSQPIPAQESWWADLSALEFRLIVESAIAIPGLDDIQATEDSGVVGRVIPERVPDDVTKVFSASMRPETFRSAYWTAFRAYLEANKIDSDTAKRGLFARWKLLTNLELTEAKAIAARTRMLTNLQDRYTAFRRELLKVCTEIGAVIVDESVTGARKAGRISLEHGGTDKRVKIGGSKYYRTGEGYLAHRHGKVFRSNERNAEDWTIMVDRATRHVQTKMATGEVVDRLIEAGRKKDGKLNATTAWGVVTGIRDIMIGLRAATIDQEFRVCVAHADSVWSNAATKAQGPFAEVPAYAAGRIAGTHQLLRTQWTYVHEFLNVTYPAFEKLHAADIASGSTDDFKAFGDIVREATSILQKFLNCFQSVYEAVVDGSRQFYEWLCDWTEKQKEKGFRTEHVWVWLCCEAATIVLQGAALAASLTFTALSMGTATAISAPIFLGADKLCEKITDKIKTHFIDEDVNALSDKAKASEYLGKEYRTAGERALATTYGIYKKVASGASALNKIDEVRERAEMVHLTTSAISEEIQAALNKDGLEALKAANDKLDQILNPARLAGKEADLIAGGTVGGIKLGLTVIGDVITLVVPPKLTQIVGNEGVDLLNEALDHSIAQMDEEKARLLKGELRRNKAREVLVSKRDGTFTVAFTLPDGSPWNPKASIDKSGATRWDPAAGLALIVLVSAPKTMSGRLPGKMTPDFTEYVYAVHLESHVEGKDYNPAHDDTQSAIVRFRFEEFRDAVEDNAERKGSDYLVSSLQGQPINAAGEAWGAPLSYDEVWLSPEGTIRYKGPTRPPARGPVTMKRRKSVLQLKKLVPAVLGSGTDARVTASVNG